MSDELRERVALMIASSIMAGETSQQAADAAIALVRDATLEEAARVVEFSPDSHTAREMQLMLDKAVAIRAMKEKS